MGTCYFFRMVEKMERLKALFITYAYPPLKYPRSVQISNLVQYLRNHLDISVLASPAHKPCDSSLLEFTPLDNVLYASKSNLTKLFDKYGGHRIKTCLFPDTFYPESRDLSHAALKHLQENSLDIIVTFGQPMSVHLAGLQVKKKFPHLRWIAHFSDPWADNPYHKQNSWVQYLNKQYQDEVFSKADSLIFTSQETIKLVLKTYNRRIKDKAIDLPHSFNPNLYIKQPRKDTKSIIIRHLGNFYGNRQPTSFFKALCLLRSSNTLPRNLKIELIGADESTINQIKQMDLQTIVTIKPLINYLESLKCMSESDLLLIIDAPMVESPFFPSKLVDYIGANQPIFGITPNGTSERVLKGFGLPTANPENVEEIARKFLAMVDGIHSSKYSINTKLRNRYSIQRVGKEMLKLLTQLPNSSLSPN